MKVTYDATVGVIRNILDDIRLCKEQKMINEYEKVALLTDLSEHDLKAGDVGTVVHVYKERAAYELEFFTMDGHTIDVVTVDAKHVRRLTNRDVLHVRERLR